MKRNIKNEKVIRAISIGLAAMIAATSVPMNVLADEGGADPNQGEPPVNTENQNESDKTAATVAEQKTAAENVVVDLTNIQVIKIDENINATPEYNVDGATETEKSLAETAIDAGQNAEITVDQKTTTPAADEAENVKAANDENTALKQNVEDAKTQIGDAEFQMDTMKTNLKAASDSENAVVENTQTATGKTSEQEGLVAAMDTIADNASGALDQAKTDIAGASTIAQANQIAQEAIEEADKAKEEYETKEAEYETAKSEYEAACKKVAEELENYKKAVEAAETAKGTAVNDLAAAEAELQKAKENAANLATAAEAARLDAEEAKNAAEKAAKIEAEKRKAANQTTYENKLVENGKPVTEAQTVYDEAVKAQDEAQKAVDNATTAVDEAYKPYREVQVERKKIQDERDKAKEAVGEAEAELATATANDTDAKEKAKVAESALEIATANDTKAKQDAKDAADALETAKTNDENAKKAAGDAATALTTATENDTKAKDALKAYEGKSSAVTAINNARSNADDIFDETEFTTWKQAEKEDKAAYNLSKELLLYYLQQEMGCKNVSVQNEKDQKGSGSTRYREVSIKYVDKNGKNHVEWFKVYYDHDWNANTDHDRNKENFYILDNNDSKIYSENAFVEKTKGIADEKNKLDENAKQAATALKTATANDAQAKKDAEAAASALETATTNDTNAKKAAGEAASALETATTNDTNAKKAAEEAASALGTATTNNENAKKAAEEAASELEKATAKDTQAKKDAEAAASALETATTNDTNAKKAADDAAGKLIAAKNKFDEKTGEYNTLKKQRDDLLDKEQELKVPYESAVNAKGKAEDTLKTKMGLTSDAYQTLETAKKTKEANDEQAESDLNTANAQVEKDLENVLNNLPGAYESKIGEEGSYQTLKGQAEKAAVDLQNAIDKVVAIKNQISALELAQVSGNDALKGIEKELADLNARLEVAEAQKDAAEEKYNNLENKKNEVISARDSKVAQIEREIADRDRRNNGNNNGGFPGNINDLLRNNNSSSVAESSSSSEGVIEVVSAAGDVLTTTPVATVTIPAAVAAAAPVAAVAGVRTAQEAIDELADEASTDNKEAVADKKQEVSETKGNENTSEEDQVKLVEDEVPLASAPTDVEKEGMSWWWLVIVTLLGAAGVTMYENHKKKVAEKESIANASKNAKNSDK